MKKFIFITTIFLLILTLYNCVNGFINNTIYILNNLDPENVYLILISEYPEIKEMAKVVGLAGEYGHIEIIINKSVYGARPKICRKLDFNEFIKIFNGFKYEIRKITIPGNINDVINYYDQEVEDKPYDLYYRSCTSIINDMYLVASGDPIPIEPVKVQELYNSDRTVREYMDEKGFTIPKSDVWLPDQFTSFGILITKGIINSSY